MAFEHGRGREGRRGVTRRERTALAGRPVALHGQLDAVRERLRQDLRAHQIEAQVRDFVRGRAEPGFGLHHVSADHVGSDRRADLHVPLPDVLAWREQPSQRRITRDARVDRVVGRVHRERADTARRENHPGGLPPGKCLEVGPGAMDQRLKARVLGRRRRGRLLQAWRERERPAIDRRDRRFGNQSAEINRDRAIGRARRVSCEETRRERLTSGVRSAREDETNHSRASENGSMDTHGDNPPAKEEQITFQLVLRPRAGSRWTRRDAGSTMMPKGHAMDIMRNGSQPSRRGPSDWFTGAVRIDSAFQRNAPARVGGAVVTFEPGPAQPGTPTRSGRR